MKPKFRAKTAGRRRTRRLRPQPFDLPLEKSVGYQVRMTDRALQRYLHAKIGPHGVTLGMWYLRILWREDGLTQRELSRPPASNRTMSTWCAGGLTARPRLAAPGDRCLQHCYPPG